MDQIQVSSNVLSYCTSCRIDLNHVVVAMKGDRVAKVECCTCKKTHVYRAPKGITVAKPKAAKSERASRKVTTVEDEWSKVSAQNSSKPARSYNTKQSFKTGEKISHPKFGEGFVESVVFPNKIKVMFRTEVKVLIHAGVPAQ